MRIAIIGSGISGLTAASVLCRSCEVVVFEASNYAGGHTNTIDVQADGKTHSVDTGFIVFNERTYPNLIKLFDRLGVASKPAPMTFSVRCDQTGLEYRGANLSGLFAWKRNLVNFRFHALLRDILRFNRQTARELATMDDRETVASWFARNRYSAEFQNRYFLPLGSAIWSCPRHKFESFPMSFIVRFYERHGLLGFRNRPQWRVVCNGSREYIGPLTRPFADGIRLNSPVHRVRRFRQYVELIFGPRNTIERFDYVVFACHADQALQILGSGATTTEREILGAFPYEINEAVLHTDESVLPKRKRAWAAWNYHLASDADDRATLTYNMNILQGISSASTFCVTLNGSDRIQATKVIRRLVYSHPVFDIRRQQMQARFGELQGANRSSYCGAYWGNGFHEDGVTSGLAAAEHLPESGLHEQLHLYRARVASAG